MDTLSDDSITKIGLLMEAAVAHQNAVESALKRLHAHIQGIDAIVRDEIRRTLVDELQEVGAECKRATQALQAVKRTASLRMATWSICLIGGCVGLALVVAWRLLPSQAEIVALREERDRYVATVAQLERRGGRADLRRCGNEARLCVRVDRQAPMFGERKDYLIVQGY